MQIGACGLRAAARVRSAEEKARASALVAPGASRAAVVCEHHYHDKSLHCMSMLRPRRDPRTAAPGLGAGVGGPGLIWGRGEGVGRRVSICVRDRDTERDKETTREGEGLHFHQLLPPSGPQEPNRPKPEEPASPGPKSACPTRDPGFPPLAKQWTHGSQAQASLLSPSGWNLAASEPQSNPLEAQTLAEPALRAFSHAEEFCSQVRPA